MVKKRIVAVVMALSFMIPTSQVVSNNSAPKAVAAGNEVVLEKSTTSNPIGGTDNEGNRIYGGDPAVLVDGDTVYLYTGHDTATTEAYKILEWMCYSTKDLKTWKYEGVTMKADKASITWANTGTDAWAGQVEKYNGKYYFYYCTWDRTSSGKQSIGVAVADKPTGPFKDIGEPLVKGTVTEPQSSDWNDIDPTVWVEKDDKGVEHRYLAWGNGKYYVCELNEDMVSVKDLNGDGKITCGDSSKTADIIENTSGLRSFTEAPWLYRRKDANGKPYGKYYMFYAYAWREQMAYATTDNLLDGDWTFGSVLMPPAATSNTNHASVFDFKGKTYFVYHNGSLPGGSGFRRNACITELKFNADGSVKAIPETAVGINGKTSVIYTNSGALLSHETYVNSGSDSFYPYKNVKLGAGLGKETADSQWVIMAGKADTTKDSYVSIQSENKPGLYVTANKNKTATLAQDADASAATAKAQTFRTIQGLSDSKGVSFESVSMPGYYLTISNGTLKLTKGSDKVAATFYMGIDAKDSSLRSIGVTLKKDQFHVNEKISTKNVKVTAFYANGKTKKVTNFTSNASKLKSNKTGTKTLKITYKEGTISRTTTVPIKLVKKPSKVKKLKATVKVKKKKVTIKLSWKKAAYGKGYEIYYGKKKKQRKYITEVKKNKVTLNNSDGFKKGKTYYIHVCTFAKFNGKNEYSKYSTIKVKTK